MIKNALGVNIDNRQELSMSDFYNFLMFELQQSAISDTPKCLMSG